MQKISESQVALVWQRQLLDTAGLATEDGRPLDVIYPGRPNDDHGADFRDAVISTGRSLLKGDVEVHVRSSDWHNHGHDTDTAYNRVVLHVVMWHNSPRATVLQNGFEVPVLALDKYATFSLSDSRGPPCAEAAPETTAAFLDYSGEIRFLEKAEKFRNRVSQAEAAQALYESIMEALGYVKNRQPFLELARRLPLKDLEVITRSRLSGKECLARLQAILLDRASLLSGWNRFKVRPQNSPARRIIAMSHLLVRYRKGGILEELTDMLAQTGDKQGYNMLEKAFVVVTSPTGTLVGRDRAAVIVINVLLPFGYAWGQLTRRTGLVQKALELYRHYPRRAANSIEKHMGRQLGLNPKLVNSAQKQQGLIHIYKNLCTQGLCAYCNLSQPHSGQHVHVYTISPPGLKTVIPAAGHHSGVVGA